MKTKIETKVNGNQIIVTTEKQHEFSVVELEILKCLFVNGYYETRFVNACDAEAEVESEAMYTLIELGLAEEYEDCWKYTIKTKNKNVIKQVIEVSNVK